MFASVVESVMSPAFEIVNPSLACLGTGIRTEPIDVSDGDFVEVKIEKSNLASALHDPNIRLYKLFATNCTGLTDKVEVIANIWVDHDSIPADRHPIAIWTECPDENGDAVPESTDNQPFGLRVYELFKRLVREVQPAYAAITVEHGLENLLMLRDDSASYGFVNFFISEEMFGAGLCRQLCEIFSNGFTEHWPDGWYFSGYKCFNPMGREVESEIALSNSCRIARLLAESDIAKDIST